jgi:hypothetical protein
LIGVTSAVRNVRASTSAAQAGRRSDRSSFCGILARDSAGSALIRRQRLRAAEHRAEARP